MKQTYWIAVLALPWGCLGQSQTSVNLTSVYNRWAVVTDGSYCPGGLDGYANCYSANLLGPAVTFGGNSFTLGPSNTLDAVSNATITLPAGQYSTLALLGTGLNGNQGSQTFTVTYTDGTKSIFTQSLSDWSIPQNFPGESIAVSMPYRDMSNGTKGSGPYYLYGY